MLSETYRPIGRSVKVNVKSYKDTMLPLVLALSEGLSLIIFSVFRMTHRMIIQ